MSRSFALLRSGLYSVAPPALWRNAPALTLQSLYSVALLAFWDESKVSSAQRARRIKARSKAQRNSGVIEATGKSPCRGAAESVFGWNANDKLGNSVTPWQGFDAENTISRSFALLRSGLYSVAPPALW